jgi:hypothetical protein
MRKDLLLSFQQAALHGWRCALPERLDQRPNPRRKRRVSLDPVELGQGSLERVQQCARDGVIRGRSAARGLKLAKLHDRLASYAKIVIGKRTNHPSLLGRPAVRLAHRANQTGACAEGVCAHGRRQERQERFTQRGKHLLDPRRERGILEQRDQAKHIPSSWGKARVA